MHVHLSALEAFATFLYVVCVGFLWRLLSAHLAQSDNDSLSAFGKAMATIY
jgi:hypothetical protein